MTLLVMTPLIILVNTASSARAQIKEVVVGITVTCPYENAIESSCWNGAYWSLMQLDGVKSVARSANGYNCTARVYVKDEYFPDPQKWTAQFKELVDQTYVFRGIEITAVGIVRGQDPMELHIPGVKQTLILAPLKHKLQWNSRKGSARQPEPDEREAYRQLGEYAAVTSAAAKASELRILVTGPLRVTDNGLTLEVREFFERPASTPSAVVDRAPDRQIESDEVTK